MRENTATFFFGSKDAESCKLQLMGAKKRAQATTTKTCDATSRLLASKLVANVLAARSLARPLPSLDQSEQTRESLQISARFRAHHLTSVQAVRTADCRPLLPTQLSHE